MEVTAYILIGLIYLLALILTVYLVKIDFFGQAAFAGPFITYPAATILAFVVLNLMSIEFEFTENALYIVGGLFGYSIVSLLIVLAITPRDKIYNIKVKGVKTNDTELKVFDEFARPTGEKIPVSALKKDFDKMTFILKHGKHHIAFAPEQKDKPYFYPNEIYVSPNYLEFEGLKKLLNKKFTQDGKPSLIKNISFSIDGLEKGIRELTLLDKSGEKTEKTVDRKDFYEYLPIECAAIYVEDKVIIKVPGNGDERKTIYVSPKHLIFDSIADAERLKKLRKYKSLKR